QWHYFGMLLPVWALWAFSLIWAASIITGLLGAIFFWRLSRWILAVSLLSTIAARPFLGLTVASASEATIAQVFGYRGVWIVSVSCFSPLARQFAADRPR